MRREPVLGSEGGESETPSGRTTFAARSQFFGDQELGLPSIILRQGFAGEFLEEFRTSGECLIPAGFGFELGENQSRKGILPSGWKLACLPKRLLEQIGHGSDYTRLFPEIQNVVWTGQEQ